ncbi:putative phloem protein [Helianthus debilis subsp. tardiflorus]
MVDDGKIQEMISAIKFVSLARHRCTIRQEPKSRFSKVAKVILPNHEMQVKISTQFLSSDVSYAAYLVCKPDSCPGMEDNAAYSLIYTLNYQSKSYISYPSKMEENGWWMFELFQTIKFKRTVDFEVTFLRLDRPFGSRSYLLFEGIHFLPIKKFKEENDLEKSELKNLSTSNVEWNNLLPSDYKQYIYYSNKDMMNTPQTDVTFPTKEEAYSILSRGVLIKVNNEVNMWFWITKLDGKKCFMLPPTLVSYNERLVKIKRIPSKESRIENVVHLSPSKVVGMRFEVPTSLLSPNTTYGCYLVYKMQQHFAWESMVTMKLDDGRTLLGQQLDNLITYLTIPQSPVIGPQGVCSSPRPINKLKTVQLPRKRKDGWLELNLGTKSDIHWMNIRPNEQYDHFWQRENSWKSCLFPCLSDNDSSNVNRDAKGKNNNFTIDPQRISNINIYMWPLCNPTETPELIVQGIEFVPV